MADDPQPCLRLQTDLNAMSADGWCWLLRHNGRLLDEIAEELGLHDGKAVVIFDDGNGPEEDDMEFDAVLSLRETTDSHRWMALPNDASFRRVKRCSDSSPA